MRKTFICTKEEPLHKQISPKESLLIEELEVKGYLDGDDYELLTEMSGEKGRLKSLDLFGVTESFPGPDYLGCFYIEEEDLAIFPYSFVNSVRLEEIVFPNNLKGIGYESFINCENLVIDELPETETLSATYAVSSPLLPITTGVDRKGQDSFLHGF